MLSMIAVALIALTSAYLTWRHLEHRFSSKPDARRLGLGTRRPTSAQEVCQLAASRLKLNVVFVEPSNRGIEASAGAPWPVRFDILDTMAIRACLTSGTPAGIGSGQHGASDWLFLPLKRGERTIAVAGVAGLHCRRRLDPDQPGLRSLRRHFEHFLADRDRPSGKAPAAKVTPMLRLVTSDEANAA